MRAVVVYESMFGNTHRVADAIGRGLEGAGEVLVLPVDDADGDLVFAADLLVVGGPTHLHGLSRARTRDAALDMAGKPGNRLALDNHAHGPGLREWLGSLGHVGGRAAAFDTRLSYPLSGRASKRIAHELGLRGYSMVVAPESFVVTKDNALLAGEEERAVAWGRRLAAVLAGNTTPVQP